MKKNIIVISMFFGVILFGSASISSVSAAHKCGAKGGTTVGVFNSNVLFASQTVISSNNTGGNLSVGNIGGSTITTGTATSTSTQTITANSNQTTITVTGTGATNTTNVVNTGNNVKVCTSASN